MVLGNLFYSEEKSRCIHGWIVLEEHMDGQALSLEERVVLLEKEIEEIKERINRLEKLVDELFVFIRSHV